jgi:hypothetical protein
MGAEPKRIQALELALELKPEPVPQWAEVLERKSELEWELEPRPPEPVPERALAAGLK